MVYSSPHFLSHSVPPKFMPRQLVRGPTEGEQQPGVQALSHHPWEGKDPNPVNQVMAWQRHGPTITNEVSRRPDSSPWHFATSSP